MRPSARSTEALGSGFTSVSRCGAEEVTATLLAPCVGLEVQRLGFGRRLLVFLARRHDDLHAPGVRRLRVGGRARDLGDFLLHVVGDDVAGELVVVALYAGLVEEL